jgi:hypothetical protein
MSFSTIIQRFSCYRDQGRAEPTRKLKRRGRIGTDFDHMRDTVRQCLSFEEDTTVIHPDLTAVDCERDSGTFEKAAMDDELTDWRDSWLSPPVTTRRRRRLIKKCLTFPQFLRITDLIERRLWRGCTLTFRWRERLMLMELATPC